MGRKLSVLLPAVRQGLAPSRSSPRALPYYLWHPARGSFPSGALQMERVKAAEGKPPRHHSSSEPPQGRAAGELQSPQKTRARRGVLCLGFSNKSTSPQVTRGSGERKKYPTNGTPEPPPARLPSGSSTEPLHKLRYDLHRA